MSEEIKVTVVLLETGAAVVPAVDRPGNRAAKVQKHRTRKRKEAERAAAALERDLLDGKLRRTPGWPGVDFAVKYTKQVLPGRAQNSR